VFLRMGRIINPWGDHFFIDKTILVAMPKRVLFFLIVPLLWTAGCEILGDDGGHICLPPPCPPNANCLNQCGDIFTADAHGGNPINLTHSLVRERGPVWSPDGSQIAFIKGTGQGSAAIYIMTRSGAHQRRLTEPGSYGSMTWSPDGAALAFALERVLYIINADGTAERRLTTTLPSIGPLWSPQGGQLLFFAKSEERWNLYVIDADGTHEQRLTNMPRVAQFATWSPDGSQIAFSAGNEDGRNDIYVINTDGAGLHRLTSPDSHDNGPVWSPDGEYIAYRARAEDRVSVTLIRADGSNRRVLVDGISNELAWSPDGQTIVYSAHEGGASHALFLLDVESGHTQPFADLATEEYDLQWSPDGSRILFGG